MIEVYSKNTVNDLLSAPSNFKHRLPAFFHSKDLVEFLEINANSQDAPVNCLQGMRLFIAFKTAQSRVFSSWNNFLQKF